MIGDDFKVEVKGADMPKATEEAAIDICQEAVRRFESESDMATFVKKDFDTRFGGKWHVIVGKAYGSFVTHDKGRFIYLKVGEEVFLMFKAS